MVRIDRSGTETFVQPHTLDKAACKMAIDTLCSGTGAGNDFIGWVDLPVNYDKASSRPRRRSSPAPRRWS